MESEPTLEAPVADRAAIRTIMSRNVITAGPELDVRSVIALMRQYRVGCIPIVDVSCRPLGMFTKSDLLALFPAFEHLDRAAREVMSSALIALEEHATVDSTAKLMMRERTHHVLVVSIEGTLVGVVSTKDIVGWLIKSEVLPTHRQTSGAPPVWHPLEG